MSRFPSMYNTTIITLKLLIMTIIKQKHKIKSFIK